jgi:hypothetical protein
MARVDPVHPNSLVACPLCSWQGAVRDAIAKPLTIVLCPKCGEPVELALTLSAIDCAPNVVVVEAQ